MFIVTAVDPEYKAFIIHVAVLSINLGDKKHPLRKAQIAHLKVDEAFIKVFSKYANFVDAFLPKLAVKLPKYTRINNHAIKLVDN